MPEETRRFFTSAQAIDAIRIAFAQYPSQLNLLNLLWPMIFGEDAYLVLDSPRLGIWAKRPGCRKLYSTDETALKRHIIDRLANKTPGPARLATICTHVFGATATAAAGPEADAPEGVWIDTAMEGFVCTRCGTCCRMLDYRDGCSLADYRRWQSLGRDDILAWVGTVRRNGEVVACRIWMEPDTNRYAETCPWLKSTETPGQTVCLIHDQRPMVCRHYPGSRKHARLTRCRGV